ncbi:MAG TPA: hypothetical protein VD931_04375 [Baekduia sp.]|nr:hypothetical protein [Baekduia sp.]
MRDTAGDAWITVVVVAADGSEAVMTRAIDRQLDMALVDWLLRVHLAVRRRGGELRVRDIPDELRGLLGLVGLDAVLGLEPRGQPELLEERGVDEVVQPRDPPA